MNRKKGGIKKLRAIYNIVPNLFWSVIGFGPVGIFCYLKMNLLWIFIFLIVSLFILALPKSVLDYFRLGKTTHIYKKAGVDIVQKLAQNGDLVNALIRKRFPDYRIIYNRDSVRKYVGQTYYLEKIHYIFLSFFLFTSIFALIDGYFLWSATILLSNMLFNVYPILLQQYNRLRLSKIMMSPHRLTDFIN